MSTVPIPYLTPQEYLAIERKAETKSEYYQGEMFAMAGATREHVLITGNVSAELRGQLKGQPCEVYASDMRVKVSPTGLYTYPDVTVVCAEPQFEDDVHDTLLNPLVVVEVLSDSTEKYDRGRKFEQYRWIDSLAEYVLIAQDRCQVDHFARRDKGHWLLTSLSRLEDRLQLPALDGSLLLNDIYERVVLADSADVLPTDS